MRAKRGTNLGTAHWRRVLEEWAASGLTQAEFCSRRGIHPATFSGRKRRLALWLADVAVLPAAPLVSPTERAPSVVDRAARAGAGAFVEARIADVAFGFAAGDMRAQTMATAAHGRDDTALLRHGAGIEIVFGESLSVRVDVGFDEDALCSVLRVLARSP